MSDFRHDHNKRDAWKKMSEWSHSVPDDELNDLFIDPEDWDEWDNAHLPQTRREVMKKIVAGLLSLGIIGTILSVSAYQLAKVLGVDNFSIQDAVVVTLCLSVIRYTDAGIIKQIK
jgi:hypothetical protein